MEASSKRGRRIKMQETTRNLVTVPLLVGTKVRQLGTKDLGYVGFAIQQKLMIVRSTICLWTYFIMTHALFSCMSDRRPSARGS